MRDGLLMLCRQPPWICVCLYGISHSVSFRFNFNINYAREWAVRTFLFSHSMRKYIRGLFSFSHWCGHTDTGWVILCVSLNWNVSWLERLRAFVQFIFKLVCSDALYYVYLDDNVFRLAELSLYLSLFFEPPSHVRWCSRAILLTQRAVQCFAV